jgi:FAD-dependent oxidoreductase domain-containing protein 1
MNCDILVVGGGILGFSSAYHLKSRHPEKNVLVIEKKGAAGQGNTAKSEGAFRNVFGSETNFLLANSTIDWFDHVQNSLHHDLGLKYLGYLWLFSEDQHGKLSSELGRMSKRGVELRAMSSSELRRSIPDLVTDQSGDEDRELMGLESIDVGLFAPKCGSVDASSVCKFYEQEFRRLGGAVKYNTEASRLIVKPEIELGIPGEPFVWQDKEVVGVDTNTGSILADTTIVATGAWSESLLENAGLEPFMRPKKRQLFVFKDPKLSNLFNISGLSEEKALPLTILPKSGVYLKADVGEGSIWLGCADDLGRRFELEEDPQAEEDYYTNNVYHVLVKYFPCFTDLRPANMWAGQYEINSVDLTPVVIPEPGMIYVGASSGSGIMKSDSLGRIVAAAYSSEENAELFGGRRFRVSDIGFGRRRVDKETFVI